MYLLDTNVISETRRLRPHGGVVAWLADTPDSDVRLPAVVVGEVQVGIERMRASEPARADGLNAWLDLVVRRYEVLPMDGRCFRTWARLMDGRQPHLTLDAMIAATAEVHGLVVATRNVRDFAVFGSRVLNPFDWKAG